jgi:hypothetical protein
MRCDGRQRRCPYLGAGKVKICEAFSQGLRVPNKREIFEYCEGQFRLCTLYRGTVQSEGETTKEVTADS